MLAGASATIAVGAKPVTNPDEASKDLRRRREILESVRSAPVMFGMTEEELEEALLADCVHWIGF